MDGSMVAYMPGSGVAESYILIYKQTDREGVTGPSIGLGKLKGL